MQGKLVLERAIEAHDEDVLTGKPVRLLGRVKARSPELSTIRAELSQTGAARTGMESALRSVKGSESSDAIVLRSG